MAKLIVDVRLEEMTSAYVEAPLDEAKRILNRNGYRIISLEECCSLRIREGKDAFISQESSWTREGFVYIPKKGVFLVKRSPILDNPELAIQIYREVLREANTFQRSPLIEEFHISGEQAEKALEDSVQIPYDLEPVPTNRFGDEEITDFLFCKQAKPYGEFLDDAGIKNMSIHSVSRYHDDKKSKCYVNKKDKPFARQMLFECLGYWSRLHGGWGSGGRMRGIIRDKRVEELINKLIQSVKDSKFPMPRLVYCATPSRIADKKKRIMDFVTQLDLGPLHPFQALEYERFEGGPISRKKSMEWCLRMIDISDEFWMFGVSNGTLEELVHALELNKPIRPLFHIFDPEWESYYEKLGAKYGNPLKELIAEVRDFERR